ncbi:hypothetical protein FB451DRAFT_1076827 [Mycena latifolia]|nr:hypothetical protein FB451DRAFT_1076827 [Mycena latifolia]
MAVSLPDEIISEILTPVLRVSDDLFSDISTKTSPFASYTNNEESNSAILLVCKAWLRVATPLLYHVVVLRSTPQAQALDAALKKDQGLGRFIKKVRVEGGFGSSMHSILKNAPNITDIFISLHLHSSDSSAGLVLGLPLINPTRVILYDDEANLLNNKHVTKLTACLESCAFKWSNMVTVIFPYWITGIRHPVVMALGNAPSVAAVSFPVRYVRSPLEDHIYALAEKPAMQMIEIRAPTTPAKAEAHYKHPANSRLNSIVLYTDTRVLLKAPSRPQLPLPLPTDPSFRPMASAPSTVIDLVWTRVLFFAMNVTQRPTIPVSDLHRMRIRESQKWNTGRLQYLLVSKTFHRLALPLLYRSPVLVHISVTEALTDKLAAAPALGVHLRELTALGGGFYSLTDKDEVQTPLFSHTPRLTRLVGDHGASMDWPTFRALAETAGATLVELSVCLVPQKGTPEVPDPGVFARFTALRSLEWHGRLDAPVAGGEGVNSGFPALESLDLRSVSTEFDTALAAMELPALRSVVASSIADVSPLLLAKHGSKLRSLQLFRPNVPEVLRLCPNLRALNMRLGIFQVEALKVFTLSFPPRHHALEHVVLDKVKEQRRADEEEEWTTILSTLDPAHFPAFRELQIAQCEWPSTERAIAHNMWVGWADKLWPYGIKVTDKTGKHWRPRLKSSRR